MTDVTHTDVVADLVARYTGVVGETTIPAKPTIPTPAVGTCGCGCGEPVARRFRPGHDARLKSNLLEVARHGDTRQAEKAAWLMVEASWSRFVDEEILIALPQRNRRNQRKLHIDEVEVWIGEPVSQPGQGHGRQHSNASCPALTRSAKACGMVNPTTRVARADWTSRRPTSPERVEHLRQSWDLCEECTVVDTVLEQCESMWLRVAVGVAALDAEAGVVAKPMTPVQRMLANQPWSVAPDVDAEGNVLPVEWAA